LTEASNKSVAHRPVIKPATEKAIEDLVSRYPVKEAALIPALHKVQDDLGWMPVEAMDWVADKLELPHVRVYGVTSYYTMFRREPTGRHRLEVCTNLSCSLMGAVHLCQHIGNKLGIKPGQTTADGGFTLTEVECLGSCGTAPVMIVDDVYYENLDPTKVDKLIAELEERDKKARGNG
jgi:NADH-quinone oxidoreductase subunit E